MSSSCLFFNTSLFIYHSNTCVQVIVMLELDKSTFKKFALYGQAQNQHTSNLISTLCVSIHLKLQIWYCSAHCWFDVCLRASLWVKSMLHKPTSSLHSLSYSYILNFVLLCIFLNPHTDMTIVTMMHKIIEITSSW